MTTLQTTFALYILTLLLIGGYFFLMKESTNITSYMLADRDINFFPMAVSEASSVASGWTFLGWVAFGFSVGLGGLIFSVFFLMMVVFLYLVMGRRFRRQSEQLESLTITDHFASYFQNHLTGSLIRFAGSLAIIIFFGVYVGSQLKSVGEALLASMDLTYRTGVITGGVAIAVYTGLGGFRASVWTDLLQGIMITIAAILLPVVAIEAAGGWTAMFEQTRKIDPTLTQLTAGKEGWDLCLWILMWFTFALGVIGQPHSLMRFQAIRSEHDITSAAWIAGIFQSIRMTLPLLIGISGRVLYKQVENAEHVAFLIMTDQLPAIVAGVLLAGIISAIISTSDSMILVASTDVIQGLRHSIRGELDERFLVYAGRGFVVLFSLIGILLALYSDESIYNLIKFAFYGLGATFGLPLLLMLYWDGLSGWGVLAGMATGLISSFVNHYYIFTDYDPVLVWPTTLLVLILVSLLFPNQ